MDHGARYGPVRCRNIPGRAAVALALLAVLAVALGGGAVALAAASESASGPDGSPQAGVEAGPPSSHPPIAMNVDIRPGLCPNHIRLDSPLAVPIAILGGVDFELDLVDPASVRLYREDPDREDLAAGVEPTGWIYADVGTPLVGGLCACHNLQGDGLDDLEFFFSIPDVAGALDLAAHDGEILPLMLRGNLTTGETIEGVDCALVISGQWGDETLGEEVGLLAYEEQAGGEDLAPARHRFSYYTTVSERVTIAIYDTRGRVVARLNDMDMAPGIYNATWNGRDENRREAAPGIYFARVNNSVASDIRKFEVTP